MTATGWSSPVAVGSSDDDDDPAVDEDEEEDDDADDDAEVAAGAEGGRAAAETASAMALEFLGVVAMEGAKRGPCGKEPGRIR